MAFFRDARYYVRVSGLGINAQIVLLSATVATAIIPNDTFKTIQTTGWGGVGMRRTESGTSVHYF